MRIVALAIGAGLACSLAVVVGSKTEPAPQARPFATRLAPTSWALPPKHYTETAIFANG